MNSNRVMESGNHFKSEASKENKNVIERRIRK